jgi:hypothetical protein
VKKTTIYLEPEVDLALARLATHEGVTKAEIIRRALRLTASSAPRPRMTVGVGDGGGMDPDEIDAIIAEHLSDELESMR